MVQTQKTASPQNPASRGFWSRRRAVIVIILAVATVAVSTDVYVLYFEPRTSCTILAEQSGEVHWSLRSATSPGDAQRSCYQFSNAGQGLLSFTSTPSTVDLTESFGNLNSEFCHPFLGIGNCPEGGMETTVIAWNSTAGSWHFDYSTDAYGENGIAFGFWWKNGTSPTPGEWVNLTLTYGQ